MTNEEAIKILNTVLFLGKCDAPKEELEECLRMAIKALEQEPKTTHWHRLPDTIDDLQDHFYYLVVYPPYKTPMKAQYHIGERMDILGCETGENVLFGELGETIKWWAELPELPLESEEKEMDEEENILKIINPGEDVNPCYGLELIDLEPEHIKALLEGKQIYTTINCGEYAVIIKTNSRESSETVTEFSDRCRECGAKYGKLLEEKSEVLDKIRAEIGELDGMFVIGDHENYYVRFWDVLSIIDKYKSEKEDK